ncbi:poly(3-hydroxyalkanoate) depolymerase [Corynebacterium pseudotuberculosis]|uniref:Poly(3-hydroxyalkanoate) depolymerase n=1 Tax=Corynebacterium pseudotuberculosis 258 TaxID=1168865 RepID=A0AAU8Q455_CORPS|nr:poly(3-hydroxyalkanoate) depolymerase [Corynebacterium pseudotuberculosis]AEQ07288.2 poly(3-hydroxyalkanoate) depolymerase [Corynebacterium pseudotuberculosis CIP 52.97]AFB73105.2 poly(3-hydroxyalkanoate) depolymerase [Corynebacterium pseudotuberculosis 316]AFK17397.1 poly(3-hydroxyalkanoate) depolymerase [Corynebacterium pseudotuberculosis 258]AMN70610.2 poly(3-hydroxyalkanoate) depolymerase [Corynebacterium pseudotuberculosis]AMN74681.1 poly(3-hydroxyalkanoate) depolymerase [Corynebacteri
MRQIYWATMRHKLGERTYIRIDPAVPNGSLLIYLHGSRQSASVARNFTDRTFDRFAEHGTTVIYPEGVSHHWNDARRNFTEQTRLLGTDDVAFLSALAASYSPVFGVGFSNGAHMLIRLLHDSPGTLTGAALIAANQPAPANFLSTPEHWSPTKILTMHGTEDPISPYHGGLIHAARGEVLSFHDTAAYYAQLNGLGEPTENTFRGFKVTSWPGEHSVEAWSLKGIGHVVPTRHPVASKFLGPTSSDFVAATEIARFFELPYPETTEFYAGERTHSALRQQPPRR